MLHTIILDRLREMPETDRYWVAYSGGMDSHGLLYAMAGLRNELGGAEIHAIHIDHGLQPDAVRFAGHASAVCKALAVPCRIMAVNGRSGPGESPEAAARRARYGAMKKILGTDEILLMAHHLDDQAETLLLQLFRGAGARGLAAMPRVIRFGRGRLGRPLLDVPQRVLREYALSRGLCWIEDESNIDRRFDRNYLRHEILPRLRERWPGIARTLGRAAAHQADVAAQSDTLAQWDLNGLPGCGPAGADAPDEAGAGTLSGNGQKKRILCCEGLRRLPEYRQRNVLMAWFRHLGLPVPNHAHIERILTNVVHARPDREPRVGWKGGEVRRYRDNLYAGVPRPRHDPARMMDWLPDEPLILPHGRLLAKRVPGEGLRVSACPGAGVEIRFRRGGERCRTAPGGHTRPLKKLFQEWGVPPWERDRIPLIFVAGELAAVPGFRICLPFVAGGSEEGWVLKWITR